MEDSCTKLLTYDFTYSSLAEKSKSSMVTDIRSADGATTVQMHSIWAGGIFGYEGDVIWVILYASFK